MTCELCGMIHSLRGQDGRLVHDRTDELTVLPGLRCGPGFGDCWLKAGHLEPNDHRDINGEPI